MKTSSNGENLIKGFEGKSLTAYPDGAGFAIGYGHYLGSSPIPAVITDTQAEAYFDTDLKTAEDAVNRLVKVPLNQNQFDALVSFTYNLGQGNFGKSTLLKKINANPSDASIGAEFDRWVHSGGIALPGLIARREREKNLYFSGTGNGSGPATAGVTLVDMGDTWTNTQKIVFFGGLLVLIAFIAYLLTLKTED